MNENVESMETLSPLASLWEEAPKVEPSVIKKSSQAGPSQQELFQGDSFQRESFVQMPLPARPDTLKVVKGDYHPFYASPLCQKQRDYWKEKGPEAWRNQEVLHQITSNPVIAESYAEMIVSYLLDGLHNGAIQEKQPLYLLELGAGCGRFSYLLLQQLTEKRKKLGLDHLHLVLLISDFVEENRQFTANHPSLQPFLEAGLAQVIPFDVKQDKELKLECAGEMISKTTNPLIVIANLFWSELPQGLLYRHYGQWFEGEIALHFPTEEKGRENQVVNQGEEKESRKAIKMGSPEGTKGSPEGIKGGLEGTKENFEGIKWSYQWNATTVEAYQEKIQREFPDLPPAILFQLIESYGKRLDSSPLFLPVGALQFLQRVIQLSGGNLFLLSADQGGKDIQWLREMPLPSLSVPSNLSLPVNFHSLQFYLEAEGAWVFQKQHQSQGLILQASIFDTGQHFYGVTKQSIQNQLEGYNADDFFMMKRSLQANPEKLNPDQMLSFLRWSHFDPKVLQIFLPVLLEKGVLAKQRISWCQVLDQIWKKTFPLGEDNPFLFSFGLFAVDLGHWTLAKAVFLLCRKWEGEDVGILHNLALCTYATGQTQIAQQCLQTALKLSPEDAQVQNLQNKVHCYQEYCKQLDWYFPDLAEDQELLLQPLGEKHTEEFLLQYRDIQIALLASLPPLQNLEEVRRWIQVQQEEKQRAIFAVIHQAFGMVGVVSYRWFEKLGYFYFWVGADYQNQKIGQRATKLLCQQAEAVGITHLSTEMWSHNLASKFAIQKSGFQPMPRHTEKQGYRKDFYQARLGKGKEEPEEEKELQLFLESINSSVEIF